MRKSPAVPAVSLAIALVLLGAPLAPRVSAREAAQEKPTKEEDRRPQPGFNLFSVEQDIEIGRQSTQEVQRQLPMLNDRTVDRYLGQIVEKMAAKAPGARFPYRIKAVNASEVNAFALPGGPMYVNRGLLAAARSEAELAGVLAHELSHIALRHGTHQASKAYLGQAGLGVLGGLLGKKRGNTAQIVKAIGGLGLNAVFLKFGRDAEYQADQLGAEIMAKSGYDPAAMADFFQQLRNEQGRDPNKVERFFSDHPPPADREARIRQQARSLGPVRSQEVGGFNQMAAALGRLPASSRQAQRLAENPPKDNRSDTRQVEVRVERPSSRFERFEQRNGFFTIEHPENWKAHGSNTGYAVSLVPQGGAVETTGGQQALLLGLVVNHYEPFDGAQRGRRNLEDATADLVREILRSNSYLRARDDSPRAEKIDGGSALSVVLSGRSPVTGEEERVTVFTRSLPDDHVIYALCIVPGRDYDSLAPTFSRMVRSLRVNEEAVHRGALTH